MSSVFQAAAAAVLALGTAAAAVTALNEDIPDLAVPDQAWGAGDELDGMVFDLNAVFVESGAPLEENQLLFRDGRFLSSMCQDSCDFGWTEYQTADVDGVLHFTVTTTCPAAPHTVVWYGTYADGVVRFAGTWTTRRWYWTRQLNVVGDGAVAAQAG